MKYFKCVLCLLAMLANSATSKAQTKIDDTNILTQLSTLVKCTAQEGNQFYLGKGYKLIDSNMMQQENYALKIYSYHYVGKKNTYEFSALKGQINTAGYLTYSKKTYDAVVNTIQASGFEEYRNNSRGALYGKGDYRFIMKTTPMGKDTAYNILFTNLARTRQFANDAKPATN